MRNLRLPCHIAERLIDIVNGIDRHRYTSRPATFPLRESDDPAARPLSRTQDPA